MNRFPALRGALLALLAAVLFGISTPFIQKLGAGVSPWMTACLLYAGAALVGLVTRTGSKQEVGIQRAQIPRLLAMALFGAVLGPTLLAWGLQRGSSAGASLLLTLEAVFTVVLAFFFYREQIDKRVGLAIALITIGGMVLVGDSAGHGTSQLLGLFAVLGATLAWGLDNTLSRGLADADPGQVVLAKASLGAACSFLVGWLFDSIAVSPWAAIGLLLIGATGYGLSLRFYLLAQRSFGAARTGSVFAAAPFLGAIVAFALGDRSFSVWMGLGAVLILAGVVVHLMERHEHEHTHEALEHEHAHIHDNGHHTHMHEVIPVGPHSHPHRHEAMTHYHPHVPDLHHTHMH